jgi:hypothetical protein
MQKLIAFGLLFVSVSIALPAPVPGVPEISPRVRHERVGLDRGLDDSSFPPQEINDLLAGPIRCSARREASLATSSGPA